MRVRELLSQKSKNDSVGSQLKSGRILSSVPKTRQTCTELTSEAMHLCSCAALLGASLGVSVTIAGYFSAEWMHCPQVMASQLYLVVYCSESISVPECTYSGGS